ncbi:MAG: OsmC family protein [Steroidobacteraceae bacterium]
MSEEHSPSVTLRQARDYQFEIAFAPGVAHVVSDESPPLGTGLGPSPVQLLLAAVGSCMSSSLYFALTKFKNDPGGITTSVRGQIGRNEAGRLRVVHIDVEIRLGASAQSLQHLQRILGQFEEFCTVGASVRAGVATDVSVFDGLGEKLK